MYLDAGRTESGGYIIDGGPTISWKAAPGVRLSFGPYVTHDVTMAQYVDQWSDSTAVATYGGRYLFAKIDQKEISANIRLDWTFTPQLSLQLYLQPLISVGTYSQFKELARPGAYEFNSFSEADSSITLQSDGSYNIRPQGINGPATVHNEGNPDFNYKSLRGNAVLRWEYLPGSSLYIVWTHQKTDSEDPGDY